jgi:hypothetical protein
MMIAIAYQRQRKTRALVHRDTIACERATVEVIC